MLLDELVGVIETLKARIEAHRETLQANETRTRVSLIDPLLCALGWDTADPALVTLEYDIHGKRADYGLLAEDGSALVFLEAKRLEESLSNHRSQIAAYASEVGIRFPALTNGDQWEVYDNSKLVPIADRRILSLSVVQDPTPKIALRFLLLWRANMASGNPLSVPETTVSVQVESMSELKHISMPTNQMTHPPVSASTQSGPEEGWENLKKLKAVNGTSHPSMIRFCNEKGRPLSNWKHIFIEVAEHLIERGILTEDRCPFRPRKTFGIDTEQLHPKARGQFSNGLYWRCPGGAEKSKRGSIELLEHFGQDPSQVWLKTG